MRGKRAKMLCKLAGALLGKEGIKLSEGYGLYNWEQNRIDWAPMTDDDGNMMKDTDGTPMMKPEMVEGTIHTAWRVRLAYQNLKKMWKRGELKS
jgi:hypothetical protein